jgi:hypothetical protein
MSLEAVGAGYFDALKRKFFRKPAESKDGALGKDFSTSNSTSGFSETNVNNVPNTQLFIASEGLDPHQINASLAQNIKKGLRQVLYVKDALSLAFDNAARNLPPRAQSAGILLKGDKVYVTNKGKARVYLAEKDRVSQLTQDAEPAEVGQTYKYRLKRPDPLRAFLSRRFFHDQWGIIDPSGADIPKKVIAETVKQQIQPEKVVTTLREKTGSQVLAVNLTEVLQARQPQSLRGKFQEILKPESLASRINSKTVLEFATGALVSQGVSMAVRSGLVLGGASGLGLAVGAGALGGGVVGGGREYWKQLGQSAKEKKALERGITSQYEIDRMNLSFRERLRDLKVKDWGKVGRASFRGALFGAAGGFVSHELFNLVESRFFTPAEQFSTLPNTEVTPPSSVQVPHNSITPPVASPELNTYVPPVAENAYPDVEVTAPSFEDVATPEALGGEIVDMAPPIVEVVDSLPDQVELPKGFGLWQWSESVLKQANPSNVYTPQDIYRVSEAVSQQNRIAVPEWGIKGPGFISQRMVSQINISGVKDLIADITKQAADRASVA